MDKDTQKDGLELVVGYMKSHWPSQVKPEWQVDLAEYPAILQKVLTDLTAGKTKKHHLVRIAGLSGSGKTTQLLPATEEMMARKNLKPVLIAARVFAVYHPHYQEIREFYGEAKVREMTDEFATVMMFLVLDAVTREGYDIILDVTLLDPMIEGILLKMLDGNKYESLILMIAVSPEVTERHLGGRKWRHAKATEQEFMRATQEAMKFYASKAPKMRIVLWNVYEEKPVYDGAVGGSLESFSKYSSVVEIPEHDEDELRQAKIEYLS